MRGFVFAGGGGGGGRHDTLFPCLAVSPGAPQVIIDSLSVCFPVLSPFYTRASVFRLLPCQHFHANSVFFLPIHLFANSSFFFAARSPKCNWAQVWSSVFFSKGAFRGAADSSFSLFFADSPKILQSFVLSVMEKKRLLGPLFFFLVSDKKMLG